MLSPELVLSIWVEFVAYLHRAIVGPYHLQCLSYAGSANQLRFTVLKQRNESQSDSVFSIRSRSVVNIGSCLYICLKDHREHQRMQIECTGNNEENEKYRIGPRCFIHRHPQTRINHSCGHFERTSQVSIDLSVKKRVSGAVIELTFKERKPRCGQVPKAFILTKHLTTNSSKSQNQEDLNNQNPRHNPPNPHECFQSMSRL
jgi:hypothetical protein